MLSFIQGSNYRILAAKLILLREKTQVPRLHDKQTGEFMAFLWWSAEMYVLSFSFNDLLGISRSSAWNMIKVLHK